MGPSGAGKTTLLNNLMFHNSNDYMSTGEIMYKGETLTKSHIKSSFGYVTQADHLLPMLTVYETLFWNIKLKFNLTEDEVRFKTFELLKLMDLEKCSFTRVGDADQKGISGGQKKRLCIALELTSAIKVLVLDEPTSGLDSFAALSVMMILDKLAKNGLTVVCTVHQPSSEITAMFDNLLLLCDGNIIYNGNYTKSITYFNELMKVHEYPPLNARNNPVDEYMRWMYVAYDKYNSQHEVQMKRVEILKDNWNLIDAGEKETLLGKKKKYDKIPNESYQSQMKGLSSSISSLGGFKDEFTTKRDYLSKIIVLSEFCFIVTFKNITLLTSKLLSTLVIAVLILTFYAPLSFDTVGGFLDRFGMLFLMMNMTMNISLFSACNGLMKEKPIIIRDQSKNLYQPWMYLIGKNIPLFLVDALMVGVLVSLVYYPSGLNMQEGYKNPLYLYALLLLMAQVGYCLGQLVVSLGDSLNDVQIYLQLFIQPLTLTCGVFANMDNFWFMFKYMKYVNPFSYVLSGLMDNELNENAICLKIPEPYRKSICSEQALGIFKYPVMFDTLVVLMIVLIIRGVGIALFQWALRNRSVY